MAIISNAVTIADAGAFSASLGSMVHIKTLTASSSGTLSFVDGADSVVLDDTYPIYKFEFINIHPATNGTTFQFNLSTDSGSNYNVTKTTTAFRPFHYESDGTDFAYETYEDLAQGTGFQTICQNLGNANDENSGGSLTLFNPSSTTYVKNFISRTSMSHNASYPANVCWFIGGYGNTTSAVDAVRFQMASGNIDAGKIKLYGIKDS